MIVTITSIKLRSLWGYFTLSWNGFKIMQQTKGQHGFISMKNTGFGYDHYTLTSWESEEDMKNFSREGAHKEAMKLSRKLSTEIRTYSYQTDALPAWTEAKQLLLDKGKLLTFH